MWMIEFVMLVVYPSEFLKLMFQVLTLHQHYSFSETQNIEVNGQLNQEPILE